jgi:hypothetical protein
MPSIYPSDKQAWNKLMAALQSEGSFTRVLLLHVAGWYNDDCIKVSSRVLMTEIQEESQIGCSTV